MNNNTKLFGVLVAALFAFGAFGASAQTGFSTFVELGDWEYDIGDSNVHEYCILEWDSSADACVLYTTNADTPADYTKGDLYLGPDNDDTDKDVAEGFVRVFNTHGFDAGTLVQDGDADEGAAIKELATTVELAFIQSVADDKLQNAELNAFFISDNETGTNTTNVVAEDDLSFADGERIDDDHDLIDAELTQADWTVLFADLDGGGSSDHDEGEPVFADIDGGGTVTVGDLILSGDDFFTLVTLESPYLANPSLIALNATGTPDYFLAILDEQGDYEENGYRGEDILLVRNATGEGFTEPRVGENSYVLTGDRQGELIDDGHPFHEEEFADIGALDNAEIDKVRICALVGDADDDPVTFTSDAYFHIDADDCDGEDADAGDVNIADNDVLANDAEGELASFIDGTAFTTGDGFNHTAWSVLDLNHDGDVDDGEPIVLDSDDSGDVTSLDLVFTEDGAFFAGPGYGHMAPNPTTLLVENADAADADNEVEFCTYYEEEEDDAGNDIWVAYGVFLRGHHWSDDADVGEGQCADEEDVLFGDFVLAGDTNVGGFLTEAEADEYEGEYSTEAGAGQSNYTVMYDDLFPSGFGPEDVVFLVESGKPKLDEESFYLGGPAVRDGDDYYFTDTDDLVGFGSDSPFVLFEGDNRGGLSEADWVYLTFDGSIDDETLILYKGGSTVGEEPEEPETPEEPEEPETPEEPEEPETPEEPDKKQPGFEALALVAALGAALVLVRRRN